MYQKHDLAIKHKKILWHPDPLGRAKIIWREGLPTTKSKPSATVQHPGCFCYKLPLIREVILWKVTYEK